MKNVLTTFVCTLLISSSVFAQRETGGLLLDKQTGKAVGQGKIIAYGKKRVQIPLNKDGQYSLDDLPAGRYTIMVTAPGYEAQQFEYNKTTSESLSPVLHLIPLVISNTLPIETFVGGEESFGDDYGMTSDPGRLLKASQDPFNNASGFVFSSARFRSRGYDSQYGEQYLNGVPMLDLNNGYSPWSLWGGLNDMVRNQENSYTQEPIETALGNIGITSNISLRASDYRAQRRLTYSNSNRTYSNRAMFTWSTGQMSNGWSIAASLSRRWGDGQYSYVRGTYYDAYGYFLALEKQLGEYNSLGFVALASPTRRGVASASSKEAYELVGSNFYNPNIGRQGGKWRNAREKNNHEPILQLSHYFDNPNIRLKITNTLSYRFGKNYYGALNWYNAPDPRPDYYRYLPSYFTRMADPTQQDELAASVYEDYWHSEPTVRYIDWDRIYQINRNNTSPTYNALGQEIATGKRAQYMIEHRHTDQKEWAWATSLNYLANDWLNIDGGFNLRYNKTSNYDVVGDLLGADYVYDIDKFAERDFGGDASKSQIDLNNPDHIAREGDRFNYDYDAHIRRAQLWANGQYRLDKVRLYTGISLTHTQMYRVGNHRRGLFPDNSFGQSAILKFTDLGVKLGLTYQIDGRNYIVLNTAYQQQAPYFNNLFLSPRTRNSQIQNPKSEQILSGDLSYEVRWPWLRGRLTAFYTQIADKTYSMNFYDDAQATFSNYSLSGIATRHMGLELGLEAKLSPTLSATAVVSLGQYQYSNNPEYVQTIDNSSRIIDRDVVYWKGLQLSGTPQTAATLGLTYRAPWYGIFGINANYFGRNYISMNPVLRTEKGRSVFGKSVILPAQLNDGFTIDVFAGYSWRIMNNVYLRLNLSVNNLLNAKNIHSGGYEQLRVRTRRDEAGQNQLYKPFDSKYSYLYGTTFFFNTSLQF